MNSDYDDPVNLGNPEEFTVGDFALHIKKMTESSSKVVNLPKSVDDPQQRKPDITVARLQLGWEPKVTVEEGLRRTIAYFTQVVKEAGEIIPTGPGASKPQA
jgi:nucleoside-diphosphate-sugar epimerase